MPKTTLKRVHGYLAEFGGAGDVYHAAENVRDAGFKRWDVHTPFPVHGLNEAMGLEDIEKVVARWRYNRRDEE